MSSQDPSWLPKKKRYGQRRQVTISLPPALHERLKRARAAGHAVDLSKHVQVHLTRMLDQLGF